MRLLHAEGGWAGVPNAQVTTITLAGASAGGTGLSLQIPLPVLIGVRATVRHAVFVK